jgi:hypothetical protein
MAHENLDNLVEIRQLSVGGATDTEVEKLIERGLKKLRDSKRVDLEPEFWRVLDGAHRDRNIAEYEGDIIVDTQLVAALIRVTDIIAERVQELLK